MKQISIIIPAYNAEKTLGRCVESIVSQTYSNWEVWLIDDGSSDASGEICDTYSEGDFRIHVIHKKNEGVSTSRNVGIENACGEYVMFVDSDDYLEDNALELLIDAAEKCDADVVMCGFIYHLDEGGGYRPNYINETFVGGNERFVSELFRETYRKELLNPPWNKVIRKNLLNQHDIRFISDFSICEDMIFTMEILKESKKIVFLNQPLYHYVYKKGDNLVNKFHANYFEALSTYYDLVRSYLKMNNALEALYLDVDKFFIDKTISYLKKIYSHDSYDKSMKYGELQRICEDLREREIFLEYNPKSMKKKIVTMCIKSKRYYLLHILYSCV